MDIFFKWQNNYQYNVLLTRNKGQISVQLFLCVSYDEKYLTIL